MNITWVVAKGYQFDPTVDLNVIRNIGPIWGSWTTWRGCGTDNVICDNKEKAVELIDRNFHKGCNFYISDAYRADFSHVSGIKCYGGNFTDKFDKLEDIIAAHLACYSSDIVLLLGVNLTTITDPSQKHYYGMILSLIISNPETQWVLIDHPADLDKNFQDLTNLTCDNLGNVLQLLTQ